MNGIANSWRRRRRRQAQPSAPLLGFMENTYGKAHRLDVTDPASIMNAIQYEPVMNPLPRRRKSARRAEILAAAREVFLAQPYEQASVTQIAARAGCVVGTLYGYFEHKRALFDAVLTDFYDGLIADIEPKFAVLEGTADRLRFLVARHLQITLDDPAWLRVLAREKQPEGGYFGSRLHQLNRRYA
jgi:hypothetical protein